MGEYWRLIGEYTDETKTFSALTGGAVTSPYTPDEDARLVGLRVVINRSAATSIINAVQFRLSCTTFKPNAIEVGGMGGGLQTAPAMQAETLDWSIMQPVKAGVPITIEARNITADTPITVSVLLWAKFVS